MELCFFAQTVEVGPRRGWIERDGTTTIDHRVRRQPFGGREDRAIGRIRAAELSAATSEKQEDERPRPPAGLKPRRYRPSLRWSSDIPIQRAGCVNRTERVNDFDTAGFGV